MGPWVHFTLGLRDSRLLNLRAVFRAKKCGGIILKCAENVNENKNTGDSRQKKGKGGNIGRMESESGNVGRMPETQ